MASASWNQDNPLISRDEATQYVYSLRDSQNIVGTFKVFYDGVEIDDSADLPDMVDKTKIRVSAAMSQA
ncbi:hypothetical protein ACFL3D_01950 [Candidatus Omnitrophota bacterium]